MIPSQIQGHASWQKSNLSSRSGRVTRLSHANQPGFHAARQKAAIKAAAEQQLAMYKARGLHLHSMTQTRLIYTVVGVGPPK